MVPEKICPSTATYVNYFMCRCETTMSVYIPHINAVEWTVQLEALLYIHFTLFAYAPEQIGLPHCTCMSHCNYIALHIQTPYYFTYKSQINCNFYLPCYNHICANMKYPPQMPFNCHTCQLLHVHIWDNQVSIYTSYELNAINSVTRSTGIRTSHYWYMSLNNIAYICPTALLPQSTY